MYSTSQTEKKGLGYNFKEVIKTVLLNKLIYRYSKHFIHLSETRSKCCRAQGRESNHKG